MGRYLGQDEKEEGKRKKGKRQAREVADGDMIMINYLRYYSG